MDLYEGTTVDCCANTIVDLDESATVAASENASVNLYGNVMRCLGENEGGSRV